MFFGAKKVVWGDSFHPLKTLKRNLTEFTDDATIKYGLRKLSGFSN